MIVLVQMKINLSSQTLLEFDNDVVIIANSNCKSVDILKHIHFLKLVVRFTCLTDLTIPKYLIQFYMIKVAEFIKNACGHIISINKNVNYLQTCSVLRTQINYGKLSRNQNDKKESTRWNTSLIIKSFIN